MIFFQLIGFLLVAYAIFSFIFNKMQKEYSESYGNKIKNPMYGKRWYSIPAFIVGIVIFTISMLIVKVGGQEVGVKVTPTGISSESLYTGWHMIMPWEKIEYMERTVWVYTMTKSHTEGAKNTDDAIWAPTKDGIKMGFDISISWRIDPAQAPWIFQNVSESNPQAKGGKESRYSWIEENIIRAKTKSVFSLSVSNYTPTEAYSYKRKEIQEDVFTGLRNELASYRLILEQVDIREVYYPAEYEASINNKKLAEQEALRLVEVTKQKEEQLKQASIDKDIAIQKAEGEAKALQIKGNSISSNPKIVQLEWISKWDGHLPKFITGNNSMMMINPGDL